MYNIVLFSARINKNNMKQTAVEWAINEIQSNWYDYEYGDLDMDDVIEQAKEMEKEQIIEFADEYGTYLLQGGTMSAVTYNETFKSE